MMRLLLTSTMLVTSLVANAVAFADMTLNNDHSTVSFVSIKKGSAGEAHSFNQMEGTLSDKGELSLTIDLSSVETKIPIRNDRMKQMLFKTDKYPKMMLTASVDADIAEGEMKPVTAEAMLDLHGIKEKVAVNAIVTKTGGKIMAVSQSPVIISAATFDMEEGVKALQEVAKLPSIATAIPVSFVLVFE